MKIVVDACVGIKWFAIEALRPEAMRLQTVFDRLLVPDFFLLEISNIAFKKALNGEITETAAVRIVPWLRQSGLAIEDTDGLMEHALEIAFELAHPVYDCVYAALAERHGGVVISHDRAFIKRLAASRLAHVAVPLADVDRLIAGAG